MKNVIMISHDTFVKGYKTGEYLVYINKNKAGDFLMSKIADKHNRPAHIFWSWVGIIFAFPLPIILLFIAWIFSVISFILGIMIIISTRKSAEQFVIKNMIDDKNFWEYVLMYKGAKIENNRGETITFSL